MVGTMARQSRHIPFHQKVIELLISWLIPGSGFVLHADYFKGIAIFVVLGLTFFFGLLLKGSVIFPVLSPHESGFNVINILTFLSQMGYGSLSLLCLGSQRLGLFLFQGNQSSAFFDLAAFYLIIAGALNYLMLFSFYDRHLRNPMKGKGDALEES